MGIPQTSVGNARRPCVRLLSFDSSFSLWSPLGLPSAQGWKTREPVTAYGWPYLGRSKVQSQEKSFFEWQNRLK